MGVWLLTMTSYSHIPADVDEHAPYLSIRPSAQFIGYSSVDARVFTYR